MIDPASLSTPQLVRLALEIAALLRERAAPLPQEDAGSFYEMLLAAGPKGITICHLRATLIPLTLNGSEAQPRARKG